jgi:hypothetical protein
MAGCIPDRLSEKQAGVKNAHLPFTKKLPDDYLIWYEPTIDNRHPDFY